MRGSTAKGERVWPAVVAAAALLWGAPHALAGRTASQRPELLASPALQPITATPALAPTYAPQGFALHLDADAHPATFALFNDLTPAPEHVEPEKLASGVESWALTPNLQRIQLFVAESWQVREFLGPIDSPNLYQAFGLDPMNMTDPLGLHTFRTVTLPDGTPVEVLAPDPDEIARGELAIRWSYTRDGRIINIEVSQREALAWAQLAKEFPGSFIQESWEFYYGTPIEVLPDSALQLSLKGLWANKEAIALSFLAELATLKPTPLQRSGTVPRINLIKPRPARPISEIPEAWQGGRRVYKIPPGSSGGDSAYKSVSPEVRGRYFPPGQPAPVCSYCRTEPARPVDHVAARVNGGNLRPENTTPACSHCNPSKGARPAPKSPPPSYTGHWPPEWWPQWMKDWWKATYGSH